MSTIDNRSAEVEQDQQAQANNCDNTDAAVERLEDKDQILLLSRELAVALNPKRPDFNGALIIYGLYLLQCMKVKSFAYVPMVNGKRGCYRSLSELQAQYPWLTDEGIRQNLMHSAKVLKGDFIVDLENPGAVRGKSHFWLSPALIKRFGFGTGEAGDWGKGKGLIGLSKWDASRYGVLEAILLHNLRYVTAPEQNEDPVVDIDGNIHRELSPTKLTEFVKNDDGSTKRILPASRKSVSKALTTLKDAHAILEHPLRSHVFRVVSEPFPVDTSVTIVASAVTLVARRVTIVARQDEGLPCNVSENSDLQYISKTSYSNTSDNPSGKCIFPSPVSLRSPEHGEAGGLSAGGKKLTMLISDHFEASRQSKAGSPQGVTMDSYKVFHVTDYDQHEFAGYDLAYDFIGLEWYSGKPYSRKAEIEHFMEEMILEFRVNEFPFTKQDVNRLRELFVSHPGLTPEHLLPLLHYKPWDIFGEYISPPKKGHDHWHFSRRITNAKQFLRYLPQLAREYHVSEQFGICGNEITFDREPSGRPIFHYDEMLAPLLEVAFENETKLPVTYKAGEDEDGEYVHRSIHYPEFAGLPTVDHVNIDHNPMAGGRSLQAA